MAAERDRVRMLVGVGTRPDKMKGLNHKGIWSSGQFKAQLQMGVSQQPLGVERTV